MATTTLDELFELVAQIPEGKVSSYGDLGRTLTNPVSGLLVGRWMGSCPSGLPWWRVVAADGRLPVWKKDPTLEVIQHERLVGEGIEFDLDGKVRMSAHRHEP